MTLLLAGILFATLIVLIFALMLDTYQRTIQRVNDRAADRMTRRQTAHVRRVERALAMRAREIDQTIREHTASVIHGGASIRDIETLLTERDRIRARRTIEVERMALLEIASGVNGRIEQGYEFAGVTSAIIGQPVTAIFFTPMGATA